MVDQKSVCRALDIPELCLPQDHLLGCSESSKHCFEMMLTHIRTLASFPPGQCGYQEWTDRSLSHSPDHDYFCESTGFLAPVHLPKLACFFLFQASRQLSYLTLGLRPSCVPKWSSGLPYRGWNSYWEEILEPLNLTFAICFPSCISSCLCWILIYESSPDVAISLARCYCFHEARPWCYYS